MLLIVGLGNPGSSHQRQRHNIGFMAVDAIADQFAFAAEKRRFQGLVREGRIGDHKVMILKPETFMNESGRSVAEAVRFHKISIADIMVFHDELDLSFGKVRVKIGGGAAGHNGLRSLDHLVGKGYRRVRLGIDHPGHKELVTGHVLGNFKPDETATVRNLCDALCDAVPLLVNGEDEAFMTRVALLMRPTDNSAKQ